MKHELPAQDTVDAMRLFFVKKSVSRPGRLQGFAVGELSAFLGFNTFSLLGISSYSRTRI